MLTGTTILGFVLFMLVRPSSWLASLAYSASIAVLLFAALRGFYSDGTNRRYWLAFSVSGLCYLIMLYAPHFEHRVGGRIVTTIGFAALEESLVDHSPMKDIENQRLWASEWLKQEAAKGARKSELAGFDFLPQETWAGRAFHSVFAIFCGLAGGWVASLKSSSPRRKSVVE